MTTEKAALADLLTRGRLSSTSPCTDPAMTRLLCAAGALARKALRALVAKPSLFSVD
ncbi:MAG: hypothetical protein AAGA22_00055 [Pseudomonadota bacterium]